MASLKPPEDEVLSEDSGSDVTNASSLRTEEKTSDKSLKPKTKKHSRYTELSKRFSVIENMLQKMLDKNSPDKVDDFTKKSTESSSQRRGKTRRLEDSDDDDKVSLYACGHISDESDSNDQVVITDENNNENLSETQKKCLYDMFGDDAVVHKTDKKVGIVLDKAQIEVLQGSYRCKSPNFLSAFCEDTYDLFPVDGDSEQYLEVPSLDSLVECCLTKRYGNKTSFVKSKGKSLFSQPSKLVEKIAYKGQQAARLGLVVQMYLQQSLGNLLQFFESEEFDKDRACQQVKDIFSMSTKALDQIGRAGAFHHIVRRSVAMTDTALYEQLDSSEFTNLPLTGEGVFGSGLETLLKNRKEKKKQVDDLIPDVRKAGIKRKFSGAQSQTEASKRPTYDRASDKPSTSSSATSSSWNNFRIPRLSRETREDNRHYSSYRSRGYNSYNTYRRPASGGGRGRLAKPNEK